VRRESVESLGQLVGHRHVGRVICVKLNDVGGTSPAREPTSMRNERSRATRILRYPLDITSAMSSDSEAPLHEGSEVVDSIIVGGGIAGLSAALFLARAGRSTIVYDLSPAHADH
jgi:NADPH-dependent 2,4-dienoyl-CoA reductase/sulfur reductase-like enzyme